MPKQFRVSQNLNSKVYNLAWAKHRESAQGNATQRCQSVVHQIPLKNAATAIQPSCSPKVRNPSSLTFRITVLFDACKARPFSSTPYHETNRFRKAERKIELTDEPRQRRRRWRRRGRSRPTLPNLRGIRPRSFKREETKKKRDGQGKGRREGEGGGGGKKVREKNLRCKGSRYSVLQHWLGRLPAGTAAAETNLHGLQAHS